MTAAALMTLVLGNVPAVARVPTPGEPQFTTKHHVVLGLDLRNDARPEAKIVVNTGWPRTLADVNLALPFAITRHSNNPAAAFRVGQFDNWTLISFWGGGSSWPQELELSPVVTRREASDSLADEEPRGIELITAGQQRHLRYAYPNDEFLKQPSSNAPEGMALRTVDAVAIALPPGAREFAVKNGQLSIPARIDVGERAFPGRPPAGDIRAIEVVYEVPPTDLQKLIVEWGGKFLAASLPLIGFWFVDPATVQRKRWQFAVVIIGSITFVSALGLIIWAAGRSNDPSKIYFDVALLAYSTLASAAIWWTKARVPAVAATPAAPTVP